MVEFSQSGREELRAWALYLIAALLLTWPLVLAPSTTFLQSAFASQHLFVFEWLRDELLEAPFVLPIWCDRLLFPGGGVLIAIGWPSAFLWLLVRTIFAPLLSFHLLLWLQLCFAGQAMRWLAKAHGASEAIALTAGAAFAFAPFFHSMVWLGEIPNLWHGLLPLAMIAIRRLETWWSPVIWGSLTLLALNLATPYYGIFGAMLLLPYALVRGWAAANRRGFAKRVAAMGVIVAAGMLPITNYYALLSKGSRDLHALAPAHAAVQVGGHQSQRLQASLLELIWPFGELPLISGASTAVSYLGFVLVAFALVGLRSRAGRIWWLGALWGISLSCGEWLYWTDSPLTVGGRMVPMPLAWIRAVHPLFDMLHVPYRAALISHVCLAMALAEGLKTLRWPRWPMLFAGLWCLDVLAFSPVPWPNVVMQPRVSSFFDEAAASEEDFALIEFPPELPESNKDSVFRSYILDRALHGKAVPWTDSVRRDRMFNWPNGKQALDDEFIQGLLERLRGAPKDPTKAPDPSWCAEVGFRYLVVYTEHLDQPALRRIRAWLDPRLRPPRRDGTLLIYPLRAHEMKPHPLPLEVRLEPFSIPKVQRREGPPEHAR